MNSCQAELLLNLFPAFSYFLFLTLTVKFMISHAQTKHKEESYESDKRQISERLSETSHFTKCHTLYTANHSHVSVYVLFIPCGRRAFVSRLIGTNALSAINLTAPVISLVTAVTMLATGGSAVIMKKWEKKENEARQDFTQSDTCKYLVGLIMGTIGYFAMNMIFPI